MDLQMWGPVESGLIGAAVATVLTGWWSRRVPSHYQGWSRAALYRRHRTEVRIANGLFIAGLLLGVALYPLGEYARTDPRPLLLGFGLASLMPLMALVVVPWLSARSIRAAFVAFSHGQGAPLWVAFPPLAAGLVALCFGIVGLVRGAA